MTVASATNRKTFAGNGVTTSFGTTPLVFFATSDLIVTVTDDTTGAVTELVENTDYTVSGGGEITPAVGTVSLAGGSDPYGAPASGTTLTIYRDVAITQEVDHEQNDGSDAQVAEGALDRLTIIAQRLDDRLDRTVHLPDGDVTGESMELPVLEDRASKVVGFDADGGLRMYEPESAVSEAANINFQRDEAGSVLRSGKEKWEDVLTVSDFGAAMDGTDDTAAWVAAYDALPTGGGTIFFPNGIHKGNLTILKDGVRLVGPGLARSIAVPLGNYFAPADVTLPVFKIANDNGTRVTGCSLENMVLYGAGTGQRAIQLAGGAYRNMGINIHIINFTLKGLDFKAGSNSEVSYNKFVNFMATSNGAACDCVSFDASASNSTWVTANAISNFDITASVNGRAILCDSNGANFLTNGWIECSAGTGVWFLKTQSTVPYLIVHNVVMDSPTDGEIMNLYTAQDRQGIAFNGRMFEGRINVDGQCLVSDTSTTGDITTGTATLEVASATDFWAGRGVLVMGAGSSGHHLGTTVLSVSGTTVTLAANAGATVTGATVYVGDIFHRQFGGFGTDGIRGTSMQVASSNLPGLGPIAGSFDGTLYQTNAATGSKAVPWTSTSLLWELGAKHLYMLQNNASAPSISSLARVGTTVTLTTGAVHNAAVGDFIQVDGALEDGFNGTYSITSVGTTSTLTYTSSVNGNATATGTALAFRTVKRVLFENGYLTFQASAGIRFFDHTGVRASVFTASNVNSNFFFNTPHATDGTLITTVGSALTTSNRWLVVAGGSTRMAMNTYGSWGHGMSVALAKTYIEGHADTDSAPSTDPTAGYYRYSEGGRMKVRDSAGNVTVVSKLKGSKTYDPGNLVDGAGETTTVTCTGAALGDFAQASFSLDLQGIMLVAYVSAADTVTVRFQNETVSTIDLGSGTLRVAVEKAA